MPTLALRDEELIAGGLRGNPRVVIDQRLRGELAALPKVAQAELVQSRVAKTAPNCRFLPRTVPKVVSYL